MIYTVQTFADTVQQHRSFSPPQRQQGRPGI